MIYLLAESHLSIHTFVDEGKITLDLFTCYLGVEYDKLKSIIKDFFDVHVLNMNEAVSIPDLFQYLDSFFLCLSTYICFLASSL